ncbi:MAG: OmpW family outer membrane protein, partial [Alphaproteobacteria bacterium]|nr:OmpW family outer membrane protein [Alphaproteobacteria bacterium]
MIYRTLLLLTILGLSVTNPVYSKAADSEDWLIRARALAIQTNADGTSNEMGGSVKTGDDLIPEIDITYYLADNISVETMFGIAEYNVQL